MPNSPTPLALTVAAVGELLDTPTQTINGWRNDGLLPELGKEGKGRTGARRYSFGDIFVLAIMRHLTAGGAGIPAHTAALLARSCRGMLVAELTGREPPGQFAVLEIYTMETRFLTVPGDDLAEYVADWCLKNHAFRPLRLEILDVREVAMRLLAKVVCLDGQPLEGEIHIHVRDRVQAAFEEWAGAYLRDEIDGPDTERGS